MKLSNQDHVIQNAMVYGMKRSVENADLVLEMTLPVEVVSVADDLE
jgi:hypothetical protein